jgi:hypothetical protein
MFASNERLEFLVKLGKIRMAGDAVKGIVVTMISLIFPDMN